jgi:hypothetical protein
MDDKLNHLNGGLAGRYEVERELGHGGMASVYFTLVRELSSSRNH